MRLDESRGDQAGAVGGPSETARTNSTFSPKEALSSPRASAPGIAQHRIRFRRGRNMPFGARCASSATPAPLSSSAASRLALCSASACTASVSSRSATSRTCTGALSRSLPARGSHRSSRTCESHEIFCRHSIARKQAMSFNSNLQEPTSAANKCKQCEAKNKDGSQCRRMTSKTVTILLPAQCRDLPRQNRQIDYPGRRAWPICAQADQTENEDSPIHRRCFHRGQLDFRYDHLGPPHSVQLSKDKFIDSACQRCRLSFVNTNPSHNNARFSISSHGANIKATKHIPAGQRDLRILQG